MKEKIKCPNCGKEVKVNRLLDQCTLDKNPVKTYFISNHKRDNGKKCVYSLTYIHYDPWKKVFYK